MLGFMVYRRIMKNGTMLPICELTSMHDKGLSFIFGKRLIKEELI